MPDRRQVRVKSLKHTMHPKRLLKVYEGSLKALMAIPTSFWIIGPKNGQKSQITLELTPTWPKGKYAKLGRVDHLWPHKGVDWAYL